MAIDQEFEGAAVAIFVAAILDSFDGRVARLTNTTLTSVLTTIA